MDTKHTPGPWTSGNDGLGSIVWSPDCGTICRLTDEMVHHRENAALIAAAPEMYAALMCVYGYLMAEHEDYSLERTTREVCAALDKAEGL